MRLPGRWYAVDKYHMINGDYRICHNSSQGEVKHLAWYRPVAPRPTRSAKEGETLLGVAPSIEAAKKICENHYLEHSVDEIEKKRAQSRTIADKNLEEMRAALRG